MSSASAEASSSSPAASSSSTTWPELPTVEAANPNRAALDSFKVAAAVQIAAITGKSVADIYNGVDTGKASGGLKIDFSVALARFRLGGKPEEWGDKIVAAFVPNAYLDSVSTARGVLMFTVNHANFAKAVLNQIHSYPSPTSEIPGYDSNAYGCNPDVGKGKKVIVEFSSPNIAKPFHAGHLRSTIIGAFTANLYETFGWEVVRMNYLGDWGKQFGLLAIGFERHGSEEELKADAIKHLFDVYVQINKDMEAEKLEGSQATEDAARLFFRNLEEGDPSAHSLWSRFRDLSIERYKQTYARLNIHFDVYSGESQVKAESMSDAITTLQEMGVVVEKDGALLADLTKYKLEKTVVRKKDGTTIYITRDIGAAKERSVEYKFDKMIYVVASQQNLHLAQFFKVLELMGYDWAKDGRLQHINFGMVTGMSTRRGTVKFLNDILEAAAETMMEQMKRNEAKFALIEEPERCADILGMSAVKIQDMGAKRHLDYTFDLKKMTAFEGDTGVYLQYAHVRLASVQRKNPNIVMPSDISLVRTELLVEDKAHDIVYLLATYPDVVSMAYKTNEPSAIVTFAFKLAHAISSAWDGLRVQNVEVELATARLYLFISARDVLATALKLLTLEPLDRM